MVASLRVGVYVYTCVYVCVQKEKEYSSARSTELNKAHEILKNPVSRAQHLVRLLLSLTPAFVCVVSWVELPCLDAGCGLL